MTTEVHGAFRPFFYGAAQSEKDRAQQMLNKRFATLDQQLGDSIFLVGEQMTIADAYLFVILSWAAMFGIAVSERLSAYLARMKRRASVAKALADEGLA